jgi:hypothetical protein
MDLAIDIVRSILLPKLKKDANFNNNEVDTAFWESFSTSLLDFEKNGTLCKNAINNLGLNNPDRIISKLPNIYSLYINELAENYVLGNESEAINSLMKSNNQVFIDEVNFLSNLEEVITEIERERIFEILSNANEVPVAELNKKDKKETEVVSLTWFRQVAASSRSSRSWIKYAVAACFVLGLGFWFYTSQNEIDLPVNPVVIQPNKEDSSLQLPKPILVKFSTNSKLTDVLMDEGMGISNSNSKIKLVNISNSDRIVSIQNAIDEYQKFIEKELLTSPGAGEKNKNLIIQLENEINSLEKELTELQSKQNSYLFDGKTLTLYDISPNAITVLAFDNNYYVKKKNDFYTLIIANEPQKYSKVSDSTLKVNLEEILYRNGKFN